MEVWKSAFLHIIRTYATQYAWPNYLPIATVATFKQQRSLFDCDFWTLLNGKNAVIAKRCTSWQVDVSLKNKFVT